MQLALLSLGLSLALAQDAPAEGTSAGAPAQDGAAITDAPAPSADEPVWKRDGLGWGGFPYANYSSDDGVGFGVIGSLYFYDGHTAPYRNELYFLVYFSTGGAQTHRLQLESIDAFDTKLRLTVRSEFSADLTSNFCGVEPPGDCSDARAQAAATAAGLTDNPNRDDDAFDQFVADYYYLRAITPNLYLLGRWPIADNSTRWEVFGSWYGELKRVGRFGDFTPYEGSLYEQAFPNFEEDGFVSLFQAGIMADSRDNEPSPIRGQWSEASVRAGGPWSGSTFNYGGANLTLRAYTPIFSEKVVYANRLVLDGMWGEPPTSEMVRSGGTDFYYWFGGQRAGRGVRFRRVLGKARAMNQFEVRATVATVGKKTKVDITPVAFLDAGYWASDFGSLGDGAFVYGTGGGARIAINKNFILRGDVGVSPLEDWSPQIYLDVKNLW